jgi:hypothetical protein
MPRFHWRTDPEHPDGYEVPYTAEEEAQADLDERAAVADRAARDTADANDRTVRDRLDTALANLEAANANWATLTAAQKDAATRSAVRASAGLIRLQLRRLDAAG